MPLTFTSSTPELYHYLLHGVLSGDGNHISHCQFTEGRYIPRPLLTVIT